MNRSPAPSKVLEPDAVEHLLGSLLPDMVQLALRASELCTKVTAITNQSHWLTGLWHRPVSQPAGSTCSRLILEVITWQIIFWRGSKNVEVKVQSYRWSFVYCFIVLLPPGYTWLMKNKLCFGRRGLLFIIKTFVYLFGHDSLFLVFFFNIFEANITWQNSIILILFCSAALMLVINIGFFFIGMLIFF